ncbi:MAG: hypothetical protein KF725_00295 [Cyclobacteriaceae bacterium]|nr:hypothetical protein [Cyclobacteriaceae bacterium]UYN87093.1 MAG: hypothetical protein KIT51_02110 [Cyclobacteriaceae bacterium]
MTLRKVQQDLVEESERSKRMETELQQQVKSNDTLLKAERKRIAADLHDDIVQRMVVVRLRLEQLSYYPLPERAKKEVLLLHRELENIMADIRYLIDDLVQPKFEIQSFSTLIHELVARLSRIIHRKVEFKVQYEQDEFFIQPYIKRELYYIIQEAAQNSLNHSTASVLLISLRWEDTLWVVIEDDGQGLLQRGRGKGYGTESIKQRAGAIGAELIIRSRTPGLVILLGYRNSQ